MSIRDPRSDLRFLLPLAAGEHVLLSAGEQALTDALAGAGLEITIPTGPPWSPAAHSVDHVLLPAPGGDLEILMAEAGRVLRPGGYLLLGLVNRFSLYRWSMSMETGNRPALLLSQARRLLRRHRFRLLAHYGVRDSLPEPDLLVPLDPPGPSAFYFRYRFVPYTRTGAWLGRLAPWLAALGAHTLLYPALLFVARRSPL